MAFLVEAMASHPLGAQNHLRTGKPSIFSGFGPKERSSAQSLSAARILGSAKFVED